MSYDRRAPEPLISGMDLGLTLAAGSITPGAAFVMSDAFAEQAMTALAADASSRFTRPTGSPEDRTRPPALGEDYGWSHRQQAAARKLGKLWKQSLRGLGAPGGYGDRTRGGGGEISDEEAEAASQAFREYRDAMDWLGARCSAKHAGAVRMVVIHEEASPLARSHLVREGLSALADLWVLR